jgi:Co/Zn/Cd efflux system component
MADEKRVSTNTKGNKKKTAGSIFFWVGIAAILFCLLYFVTMVHNILEPEAIPAWNVLLYGSPTGFLFMLIGATLFFVGKRQEKKQRNLHEAHDSQADYSRTIDKS